MRQPFAQARQPALETMRPRTPSPCAGRMIERAGDADGAIAWRNPAADGGMFLVIAGMSAGATDDDPAQFWVWQRRAALKSAAIIVGQFVKLFRRARKLRQTRRNQTANWSRPRQGGGAAVCARELARQFDFFAGRGRAGTPVDRASARVVAPWTRLEIRPPHEALGLLDHERAVHQEQRLLRHRGVKPPWAARIRARKIERAKQVRQILSVHITIDRPAPRTGVSDVHGVPAHRQIQFARNSPATCRASTRNQAVAGSCARAIDCPDQSWRNAHCRRCFDDKPRKA